MHWNTLECSNDLYVVVNNRQMKCDLITQHYEFNKKQHSATDKMGDTFKGIFMNLSSTPLCSYCATTKS